VDVCPFSAISKREEDGVVIVDRDVCTGGDVCGRLCEKHCPYKSPQFGFGPNPKMEKCTFCADRLDVNKNPACVDACPTRALEAGPIEKLRQDYGTLDKIKHFADSRLTEPSIVFRPKP
jgi:anaerobic dimethyl sulfoxide reductase subunit B (iron-sulfur subunit)